MFQRYLQFACYFVIMLSETKDYDANVREFLSMNKCNYVYIITVSDIFAFQHVFL